MILWVVVFCMVGVQGREFELVLTLSYFHVSAFSAQDIDLTY